MKILMLGATGRTGKLLLEQALLRGHRVHVVTRDSANVPFSEQQVVFGGQLTNTELLKNAMAGCDAVLSTLNISRSSDFPWSPLRSPKDLLSDTMKRIIEACDKTGCRRIIFTSAWGVNESRNEIPGWFRWLIDHSNIKYPYSDLGRAEDLLQKSNLDWTAVRPAGLTNSLKMKTIIESSKGKPRPSLTISRLQVAQYMLDTLENGKHIRSAITISSK